MTSIITVPLGTSPERAHSDKRLLLTSLRIGAEKTPSYSLEEVKHLNIGCTSLIAPKTWRGEGWQGVEVVTVVAVVAEVVVEVVAMVAVVAALVCRW